MARMCQRLTTCDAGISNQISLLQDVLRKQIKSQAVNAGDLRSSLQSLDLCVQCCEIAVSQSAWMSMPHTLVDLEGGA